jgi:putative acetyltransferase
VEVTIRVYHSRDAAAVSEVFYRSVRDVAVLDYSAEQVRAWAPEEGRTAASTQRWAGDGRLVLVAADERDSPVAFIDLEPDGHIDHLFCAPEAAGHGIASQLYQAVEAAAREHGIARFHTEASELARRFFERRGFVMVARQDLVRHGVPIHNYKMTKELPQATS